jgi:hypothetical protein
MIFKYAVVVAYFKDTYQRLGYLKGLGETMKNLRQDSRSLGEQLNHEV